jgi:uncharacterized protein YqcC (DUF446 family)
MSLLDLLYRRDRPASTRDVLVGAIEQELRRLQLLDGPLSPPVAVASAFGAGEMPFEHWLAKVFMPRLREAQRHRRWPPSSQVALAAMRNFDGQPGYAPLLELLGQLDADINGDERH